MDRRRAIRFLYGSVAFLATVLFAAQPANAADFSRLVVVGDSLAAGVENGSLVDFQQRNGFAAVIARQLHTRLDLPLVPYPGAPNTLELVSPAFPPVVQQVPGTLIFPRLNPFDEITDVAVPLQTVADALTRRPDTNLSSTDETQLATDLVLGFPCPVLFACPALTQVEQAIRAQPTAIVIEIGSNDILGPVNSGNAAALLASPQALLAFLQSFAVSYDALLNQLSATKATLIVGNIPDITETAFFTPVAKLAEEANVPLPVLLQVLGLQSDDLVTLNAVPAIEAILSNATQGTLAQVCAATNTICVVSAQQAALIRAVIQKMNSLIATGTTVYGATLVDVFALNDRIYHEGYTVRGVKLTSDFLGGMFSLDGIHPTNTGYGIMANAFLDAINCAFHHRFPLADIAQIAEHDPLVLSKPRPERFRW